MATPQSLRRPSVRGLVALTAAVSGAALIAGGLVAVPTAAADRTPVASTAEAPAAVVPRIAWRSCGAALAAFQCASVEVPTDYDRARGATTTIALTRLPAAKPALRVGTLFTNPGGPGGSGVDFVHNAARVAYTQSVRDRFDILGFDPRGVSRSDPATCYSSAAEEEDALAQDIGFPITRAQVRPFQAANREFARRCASTSPERFRHISTANVARDMDLLRRAVGDRKLNYAGYSYGTFLGATYAKLFPNRIRAMVLDGTLDPREYSGEAAGLRGIPIGNRIEQDRGGAEVFAEFLRQCRRVGASRCSLAGPGDPARVADSVFDALEREPRVIPLPDGTTLTLTYQLLVIASFQALYSPTQWTGLADLLSSLAQPGATARRAPLSAAGAAVVRRGQDYPSVGGALGSTCVDAWHPSPQAYAPAAERSERRFPLFGRFRTWVAEPCTYLLREGIRDTDAYRGPWQQQTRARVLVLGTRHDPATPYRNTRPYAGLFPRASVTTLEGWGHTTIAQSRCVDARITAYLLDPDRARGDVRCATDLFPFTAATDARSGAAAARAALTP